MEWTKIYYSVAPCYGLRQRCETKRPNKSSSSTDKSTNLSLKMKMSNITMENTRKILNYAITYIFMYLYAIQTPVKRCIQWILYSLVACMVQQTNTIFSNKILYKIAIIESIYGIFYEALQFFYFLEFHLPNYKNYKNFKRSSS